MSDDRDPLEGTQPITVATSAEGEVHPTGDGATPPPEPVGAEAGTVDTSGEPAPLRDPEALARLAAELESEGDIDWRQAFEPVRQVEASEAAAVTASVPKHAAVALPEKKIELRPGITPAAEPREPESAPIGYDGRSPAEVLEEVRLPAARVDDPTALALRAVASDDAPQSDRLAASTAVERDHADLDRTVGGNTARLPKPPEVAAWQRRKAGPIVAAVLALAVLVIVIGLWPSDDDRAPAEPSAPSAPLATEPPPAEPPEPPAPVETSEPAATPPPPETKNTSAPPRPKAPPPPAAQPPPAPLGPPPKDSVRVF